MEHILKSWTWTDQCSIRLRILRISRKIHKTWILYDISWKRSWFVEKWKYALDGQILTLCDWLVRVKVIAFHWFSLNFIGFQDSSSLAIQFGILETRRKDHFSQLLRQIKFNSEYECYRNLIKYFIKWHFTASKMQRIGQKWPNCIF